MKLSDNATKKTQKTPTPSPMLQPRRPRSDTDSENSMQGRLRPDNDSDASMQGDSTDNSSDNSSDTSFDEILRKLQPTNPHQSPTLPTTSTLTNYTIPATPGTDPASNSNTLVMNTTTDSSPLPDNPPLPPIAYDSDGSYCSIDDMIAKARVSLNKSHTHNNFHPVCFTWKETIHPNSNIQSPDIIAQPSKEDTTVQHPLIQKLAHFLSTAQKRYATNLTVKTSLSNVVLSLPDLLTHWSVNDTKQHFN